MQGRDLGFIGGGRITSILLEAMRGAGLSIDGVLVSDANEGVRTRLAGRFPQIVVTEDNRRASGQRIVFLALHPPALKEVLPCVASALAKDAIVVSLAPALTFAKLRELLAGFARLVRVIPNAPSLVHAGFNPVCFAPEVPRPEREELLGLMGAMGRHPEVAEETLEAYAILTAMGPTYLWFQWQTLRELGRSFGLGSRETDAALSAMIQGAAKLHLESGLPFEAVEDSVPVKPLAEAVPQIREAYVQKLTGLFRKLKGQ